MAAPRYFHSKFLFLIPISQAVLLITLLDFIKNTVYFARQTKNLAPSSPEYDGTGTIVAYKVKDAAYLVAQYVYTLWLGIMMIKAIVGCRANYVYHVRWMGVYNILLAMDCVFEFVRTNLGAVFTDLSRYSRKEIVHFYCLSYFLLFFQLYCFIFCWMHLRWVQMEMPYLSDGPPPSLWRPRREEPGGRPPLPGHRRITTDPQQEQNTAPPNVSPAPLAVTTSTTGVANEEAPSTVPPSSTNHAATPPGPTETSRPTIQSV